jgi:hypothetical protein
MHCGNESGVVEETAGPADGFQNEKEVNEPEDFTGQSGDDVISYRNALLELLNIVVPGNKKFTNLLQFIIKFEKKKKKVVSV